MIQMDAQKLLRLAADRTPKARAELTHAISDLFLPETGRLTEQERALMQDVLGKLITSIEIEVRTNLAEALVRSKIGLPDLERMLANDDIEVARPVLEKSTVLADVDLISIIRQRTDEHRMVIAMRDMVSEKVTEQLVHSAGSDVIETLLRNPNAMISRRAMEYLVAESKRQDRFQEPLVLRNDLPVDLAHRMYWWVTAALRRKIIANFTIDETLLDAVLQEATQRALVDQGDDQSVQARAMRLAHQLYEAGELDDHMLVKLLRQHRLTLFIACLAVMSKISYATSWRVVTDSGFDSPVVLGRAIGLSRQSMTEMLLLLNEARTGGGPRSTSILTNISMLYDEVDPVQARRVLSVWQRDTHFQDAIDRLATMPHTSADV
jgi:uncharacterized protein (DUF2336 family)